MVWLAKFPHIGPDFMRPEVAQRILMWGIVFGVVMFLGVWLWTRR